MKDWFHALADEVCAPSATAALGVDRVLLDLAFGLTQTSRLGCQIIMSEELDGLVVALPAGVRNMMNR